MPYRMSNLVKETLLYIEKPTATYRPNKVILKQVYWRIPLKCACGRVAYLSGTLGYNKDGYRVYCPSCDTSINELGVFNLGKTIRKLEGIRFKSNLVVLEQIERKLDIDYLLNMTQREIVQVE